MKINALERAMILFTAVVLAFFGGYFYRGNLVKDTIIMESEKTPAASAIPIQEQAAAPAPSAWGSTPKPSAEVSTAPVQPESAVTSKPSSASGKIDLNTATESDLETLPGIGPVLARRILEYREENGDFHSIDEIMYVSGIGEKIFDKIANQIEVGGSE